MPSPFSPSSLASLELCQRKWAWAWIDGVHGEGTKYTLFGTKVHSHLEAYYRSGIMPDLTTQEGNCAIALLAHLPPPQPGLRIEERRYVGRFEGTPDLTFGNRVWDHKTTSDHKWALTDLAGNLQAAIYAWFVMQETGELRVTLQWNYVTREKRPRVLPVIQTVSFGDIARTLDRANALADVAQDILDHRRTALSLEPNPEACEAYGGCQYRDRCNLGPGERMSAYLSRYDLTEGKTDMTSASDFAKDMAMKHGGNAAAAPPPPPPGNPWDKLGPDYVTPTMWYNVNAPGGPNWVEKTPPPPPVPPPPAAVAPPAPPVPINPPAPPPPPQSPVTSPAAASVPAPPPAPTPHAGSPTVTAPHIPDAQDALEASPHGQIARRFEDLADLFRSLGGAPPKPRRGRPPKNSA